ncbi:MAG: hypothetical protein QOD83_1032 [Solirubrobacteraceae bacterium]|nr:hypothetical protein [Solirubrobacteraceae bacterium]
MKTYALAVAAICVAMLALFGIAQLLDLPLLSSESPNLGTAGPGAAAASFALLAGDVLLPVPSSALMLLNGSLFGPIGGAALSLAGSEAAALLGWAIGRRGGPLLERVVSPAARDRAQALVRDRGALAIVLTRPIPVVAETAAILAGAAGMPLRRLALAAAVGALPPALAYALAGGYAKRLDADIAVLAGMLLLAAAFWLVARRRVGGGRSTRRSSARHRR